MVFFKILKNLQSESICARASILNKLQTSAYKFIEKRLLRRCSPANFAKFLKTSFFYRVHMATRFAAFYMTFTAENDETFEATFKILTCNINILKQFFAVVAKIYHG